MSHNRRTKIFSLDQWQIISVSPPELYLKRGSVYRETIGARNKQPIPRQVISINDILAKSSEIIRFCHLSKSMCAREYKPRGFVFKDSIGRFIASVSDKYSDVSLHASFSLSKRIVFSLPPCLCATFFAI